VAATYRLAISGCLEAAAKAAETSLPLGAGSLPNSLSAYQLAHVAMAGAWRINGIFL